MNEQVKILCVDDERNVLRALERLFMDEDYEILTAPSGGEGLEVLQNDGPVQLVISDYRMPGMNGVEFLTEVYNRWPDTVRIVLSGYADTAAIVSAINEGNIYKFIPKPWNDDELKVAVANAIERHYLHKRNAELASELKQKNGELIRLNAELKKLLDEKSMNLEFRSRVLTSHQKILDSMPVGILGIDESDMVVLCNLAWHDMIGFNFCAIGQKPSGFMPAEISGLLAEVKQNGKARKEVELNGKRGILSGIFMDHEGGQRGIILVFSPLD